MSRQIGEPYKECLVCGSQESAREYWSDSESMICTRRSCETRAEEACSHSDNVLLFHVYCYQCKKLLGASAWYDAVTRCEECEAIPITVDWEKTA